jgi:endonuclease/exonuclease/phosphatase family metal-dependent hydrolase
MTRYTLVNSGLVILSIYPIISHTFIPYNVQDYLSTDVLSEKGFLVVEIKIKQTHMYLINTHLQSSFLNEPNIISTQQMQQLLSHVKTLTHPYIIGGDFNVDYKELPAQIKKNLSVYAPDKPTIYIKYDEYGTELNTSCIPVSGYIPFSYDYFMTNNIIIKQPSVLSFEYSDHAPVQSTILL